MKRTLLAVAAGAAIWSVVTIGAVTLMDHRKPAAKTDAPARQLVQVRGYVRGSIQYEGDWYVFLEEGYQIQLAPGEWTEAAHKRYQIDRYPLTVIGVPAGERDRTIAIIAARILK